MGSDAGETSGASGGAQEGGDAQARLLTDLVFFGVCATLEGERVDPMDFYVSPEASDGD